MSDRPILCTMMALMVLGMPATAPSQSLPRRHVIVVRGMSFARAPTDIRVGDTVVWVNHDRVPHTATARNRTFDVEILPGRSVQMTVSKAGTINFQCTNHPAMRSRMTIAEAE